MIYSYIMAVVKTNFLLGFPKKLCCVRIYGSKYNGDFIAFRDNNSDYIIGLFDGLSELFCIKYM